MKQKTRFSKAMAICLAMLLTLAMAIPAMAYTPDTSKITVGVNKSDSGKTLNAYQVITASWDTDGHQPQEPEYLWADSVKATVQDQYSDYIDADGGVTEAFSQVTGAELRDFYETLRTTVAEEKPTKTVTIQENDDTVAFDGMAAGGYLIFVADDTEQKYAVINANLFPVYGEDGWTLEEVSVKLKDGSTPDIDKEVTSEGGPTVAIGDTVSYKITADVPYYPADSVAQTFLVGDKPSVGLTLQENTIAVQVDGQAVDTSSYELTTEGKDGGFEISFKEDFIMQNQGKQVVITYDVMVNEHAFTVDALGNAAYNGWNDPYDEEGSKQGETDVDIYTYGIVVNKVDGENAPLAGAEFQLLDEDNTAIALVKSGDGTYRPAVGDEETVTTLKAAGGEDKNTLTINGLDLGTYQLVETKAPGGYNKLKDAEEIELTDANLDGVLDEEETNIRTLKVENNQGFDLPVTGGAGTVIFTVVGLALIGGGILLVVLAKKKRVTE